MNLHKTCISIFIMLGVYTSLYASQANEEEIINIIPRSEIEIGCGCSYALKSVAKPSWPVIFQSGFGFTPPRMNIRGKMVELVPVSVQDIPQNARVGSKFKQQYKYNNIILNFDNTISYVCPPRSPCEVTKFDSIFTVTEGKLTETYKLEGDCGC